MSMNLFPYVYVYGPVLMDQQNLKTFSKHGNNNLQLIGITFSLQEHGEGSEAFLSCRCAKSGHT